MRPFALAAALFLQTATLPNPNPQPADFRYTRQIIIAPASAATQPTEVCAILDAALYAHAPTLADVRLFSAGTPVPYALTSSGTSTPGNDPARVLNTGLKSGHVVFDLEMPARPYSSVILDLAGENYLATARVTGLKSVNEITGTALGTFTLFNLAGQRLGANTTLALQEASFPFLHVDLELAGVAGRPAPEVTIQGAEIPPSREAQTLYTPVAFTSVFTQRGRESVASIHLPAHVPVERVTFALVPASTVNFSRTVILRARPHPAHPDPENPQPAVETLTGEISRVRLTEAGKEIRQQTLSIPATLGANAQDDAEVEVAIQNGDDRPLALASVQLEMREHKLCFDAPAPSNPSAQLTLYYGNPQVEAPIFDYARLFDPAAPARPATLTPEALNPAFTPHVERKSLTERHPELLWVALLAMVSILGIVAFRSAKKI